MYALIRLFGYLWQLPQNVLGAIISALFASKIDDGVYEWKGYRLWGSVSLGDYIILSPGRLPETYRHEVGHQVQSMILGPLYLLVIGIPSICWAALWTNQKIADGLRAKGISYYDFYTESWADRLGNVHRS